MALSIRGSDIDVSEVGTGPLPGPCHFDLVSLGAELVLHAYGLVTVSVYVFTFCPSADITVIVMMFSPLSSVMTGAIPT